ncbi:S1C family serine protease [Nocardioides sp. AX2bis]|uniref:S1C family serine protease n=1 Tax=Nocardioides sp. AX2bis TaxID=2653157 RepID=UPI0012F41A2E|nr:trypsin-like peptidase domain-containing protein [Nocardioides sp. AX2bis]VXB00361.1 Trypsin [Nocardioides sp. AX2bis]
MSDQTPTPDRPSADQPSSRPSWAGDHEPTTELGGTPAGAGGQPPYGDPYGPPFGSPAPAPRERSRGRKRFAAGVLTAALVVGGGAGLGGAAAYSTWFDDDGTLSSGGGSSSAVTTSPVVDTGEADGSETDVEQVAAAVLPSVVKLDVAGQEGSGSGSGVIISSDGRILTNNHVAEVAEGGGSITISFSDGSTAPAEIVGTDPITDVAVVQAQGVSGLTPATIGSSADLNVGEDVVAIGSPYGLDATVTSGIVSALGRPVDVGQDDEGNVTAYPAVQTDAAINPGNSGGPLVDSQGRVVGINSSIRTSGSSVTGESSGSIGLGFAIPIDDVRPIVDQIIAGEEPTHALLGISVQPVQSTTEGGAPVEAGAQVAEVNDGSAAQEAGLEAEDVVTGIDDTRISDPDSLITTVRSYRPGDEVEVTYVRGGDEETTTLTLGSDGEVAAD